MDKDLKRKVIEYVTPYYSKKDIMHNLSHINRIIRKAKELSKNYNIDFDLIEISAYFHGIIKEKELDINNLLKKSNINENKLNKIISISKASHKDIEPKSIEEKILHDAHILEGGKYFQIIKSLVTGTARNQSLEETIKYFDQNIIGKFECYLPESRKEFKIKEKYSKDILKDISQDIYFEIN